MKLKYVERGAAIIILLIKVYGLFLVADSVWRQMGWFHNYHGPESPPVFLNTYFFPRLLNYLAYYISFIWLVTGLPYRYVLDKRWWAAFLTTFAGFMVAWITMSLGNYLRIPFNGELSDKLGLLHANLKDGAQLAIFYTWLAAYIAVKQFLQWFWDRYNPQGTPFSFVRKYKQGGQAGYQFGNPSLLFDTILLALIWALLLGGAYLLGVSRYLAYFMVLIVPSFFITCLINLYWLIPTYYKRKNNSRFWGMQFLVTFGINLPLTGVYAIYGTNSPFMWVIMFIVFWVGQLAIAVPTTYLIYRRRADIAKEMEGLQTDLNTTEANLDMLRAQINPHFLFNALNSLYGMALMEKADKTGEGIQLLGDMMRFILDENNKEQIALNAEIDYLKNYINLQNLRMASSPDIQTILRISESIASHYIEPMLLVPFVENAYKHGISFKEPSWIHVTLSVTDGQLQFDVRNSIHPFKENDPERNRSGIGLENVKQRLALLYPGRHSLVVRKTDTEFSIYLNLQLK